VSARTPERRVFVARAEVPRLLRGVVAGDGVALRRILGARRGGRYGALLALAATLLAVPLGSLAVPLACHALLSVAGHFVGRAPRLAPWQYQRVSLWALALPLLCAAPFRWLGAGWLGAGDLPAVVAVGVAHGLLWRGLRRGLDAAPPEPRPSPGGTRSTG